MRKWNRIKGGLIGRYGWEIWENSQKQDYYLVKLFVYDKVIDLTGNRHILEIKLKELTDTLLKATKEFEKIIDGEMLDEISDEMSV